jgi:hypothetical protein
MDAVCPACRTAGRAPLLEASVPGRRCQACGADLPVVPAEDATEEGSRAPPPPFHRGGAMLLRCQGRTWRIAGREVLRRWIVEHRVKASDLLSEDGVRWEPVDREPALRDLMRVIERLAGNHATRPSGLKDASDPQTGWTTATEPDGSAPAPRP